MSIALEYKILQLVKWNKKAFKARDGLLKERPIDHEKIVWLTI